MAPSVRFHAGRFHHARPFGEFFFYVGGKLLGRIGDRVGALAGEALAKVLDLADLPGAAERGLGTKTEVVLRERLGDVVDRPER